MSSKYCRTTTCTCSLSARLITWTRPATPAMPRLVGRPAPPRDKTAPPGGPPAAEQHQNRAADAQADTDPAAATLGGRRREGREDAGPLRRSGCDGLRGHGTSVVLSATVP